MSPRQGFTLHQVAERVHRWLPYLEMNQRVHQVIIYFPKQFVGGPPGKDNKLDPQQGHQDQSGPHRLQVHVRFRLLGFPHFAHEYTDDVEQEEEIDLQR